MCCVAEAAVVCTKVASLGLGWEIENIRPRIIKYTECTRRRVLLILKLATKIVHLGKLAKKHYNQKQFHLNGSIQLCKVGTRSADASSLVPILKCRVIPFFVSASCVRFNILFIWNEW